MSLDPDLLARSANVVLATASVAAAALILRAIAARPAGKRYTAVGLVSCAAFMGAGLHAIVRVLVVHDPVPGSAIVVADWLAAAAMLAFLSLHRRWGAFADGAGKVAEYESEFAAKEREAHALAQVNEELRRLDELKSEFLSMVSHELRTPLTAIIGYSRLAIRQLHGTLSPKQLEHQEAILRSAQRLADLINDLLDVSRLEAGRIELHPRPTGVRQIVDQVLAVVAIAAQTKQIAMRNEVPADLPLVNADSTRLQQILMNLVGNAVKFTPAGGEVRVTGSDRGSQVWVAVEDTGVGIPSEELLRIWDPFYQVGSPLRRRESGSGLGLPIVRRLVELHGGIVRAESEGVNRGSRFSFTLPAAESVITAPHVEPAETRIDRVLAGRDVLIVEDEAENQAVMRSVVEDLLGGKARVCDDGERAVHEAIEQPPALLLLDLMLPRMSGWEVARRLRQSPRTRDVWIVAVSALARPQERETAINAGCDAYIPKPFTPEEMARVISGALNRHGASTR